MYGRTVITPKDSLALLNLNKSQSLLVVSCFSSLPTSTYLSSCFGWFYTKSGLLLQKFTFNRQTRGRFKVAVTLTTDVA